MHVAVERLRPECRPGQGRQPHIGAQARILRHLGPVPPGGQGHAENGRKTAALHGFDDVEIEAQQNAALAGRIYTLLWVRASN
jgi:hypothetical protein